jgi:hypothetical protein
MDAGPESSTLAAYVARHTAIAVAKVQDELSIACRMPTFDLFAWVGDRNLFGHVVHTSSLTTKFGVRPEDRERSSYRFALYRRCIGVETVDLEYLKAL